MPPSAYARCIFHIKHSAKLERLYQEGGAGVFEEKGNWRAGRDFLLDARERGETLLIFFDHAEAFVGVAWAAQVDDIRITTLEDGKQLTRVHLRALRRLPAPAPRTGLWVLSTGEALDPNHQRGYVLCETPGGLAARFFHLNGGPEPLLLFSFGYWGWGNATRELVALLDRAEAEAGYGPPLFVDTRYRRAVRAVGFQGDAFAEAAGPGRYRWEPRLGNRAIDSEDGGGRIVIDDPTAAGDLLDWAIEAARERRRVVFICACKTPGECHRHVVGRLVLRAARERGVPARVVEWPGGEARSETLAVPETLVKAVARGRRSVPLAAPPADLAALPWYSVLTLQGEGAPLPVLTGPARFSDGWYLPVLEEAEPGTSAAAVAARGAKLRRRGKYGEQE